MEKKFIRGHGHVLSETWNGIKPVFPVTSGGLHAGIIPRLIKLLGKDIIIQVGGGVLGHPSGAEAGARSVRQSIDATLKGISLNEYEKSHEEIRIALKEWGTRTPRWLYEIKS